MHGDASSTASDGRFSQASTDGDHHEAGSSSSIEEVLAADRTAESAAPQQHCRYGQLRQSDYFV